MFNLKIIIAFAADQDSIFTDHNRKVDATWQNSNIVLSSDLPKELLSYVRAPPEKILQNPLQFWKQMRTSYPALAKISTKFLNLKASSVPPDQVFFKKIEDASRETSCLHDDMFSKLIFMKSIDDEFWNS